MSAFILSRKLQTLLWAMLATGSVFLGWRAFTLWNLNPFRTVGAQIDQLNGVAVYYNGGVGHCDGRNLAPDGYNIGIRHQCVEFVKRYYYEHLHHEMPDSYGNALEFFDPKLADGVFNTKRALVQFSNGSASRPEADDLLVFGPAWLNPYGHVAIVAAVGESSVEMVQQNPGPFGSSRETLALRNQGGKWKYDNSHLLGWLRKAPAGRAVTQSPSPDR